MNSIHSGHYSQGGEVMGVKDVGEIVRLRDGLTRQLDWWSKGYITTDELVEDTGVILSEYLTKEREDND